MRVEQSRVFQFLFAFYAMFLVWANRVIPGALVVLCGLVLFFRPTPDSYFAIGALLIGLGLVIMLVSMNVVIGSTCGHKGSICQIGTKPAERIIGIVIIISGLVLTISNIKRYKVK